ncbi:universal stress protein [Companilactobacillus kimchiensis]|uniref:UspA domain-containing protein n=1 Tax=Companilactobacillus kimchiensis TaxID=993692 RepID=A0A0R2LG37_9LACO|nr:universal stress protein [Companilactobacillus kimchiensis]KRO00777.1 hypothetical protein IV57_GL000097 [Companilactobacillus kimchiensis]
MTKKILVAIDGSENSFDGLYEAIDMAPKTHADLNLISVVNDANLPTNIGVSYEPDLTEQLQKDAEFNLRKAESIVDNSGLKCKIRVLYGEPQDEIIDYASKHKVSLIIMGKCRARGVERILTHSVGNFVVNHTKINTLIVN